jgi:hypothetical protein
MPPGALRPWACFWPLGPQRQATVPSLVEAAEAGCRGAEYAHEGEPEVGCRPQARPGPSASRTCLAGFLSRALALAARGQECGDSENECCRKSRRHRYVPVCPGGEQRNCCHQKTRERGESPALGCFPHGGSIAVQLSACGTAGSHRAGSRTSAPRGSGGSPARGGDGADGSTRGAGAPSPLIWGWESSSLRVTPTFS